LKYNNNIGTINPQKKGTAKIQINHTKARFPLEIVVIIYEDIEYTFIDLNKTLIILEEGGEDMITADLVGDLPPDYGLKYRYEVEDEQVVGVMQSNNRFAIIGRKIGRSVIKIKNEYADFEREVLVIVNGIESSYDREIYITTNQNVITTEVGANDILLTMTLVGGNEADKNNFVWTVDDGAIIDVESAHGSVKYINRMVTNIGDQFEAQALIKPKKVGTAQVYTK